MTMFSELKFVTKEQELGDGEVNQLFYTVSMNVLCILLKMMIPSARMNAAKPAV